MHEDGDTSAGYFQGYPRGVMDQSINFVLAGSDRLDIRGGSQVKATLVDGSEAPMTSVLAIARYSQTGVCIVAHDAAADKHYAYLYDGGLEFESARVDLGWDVSERKPRVVELFEELYIADATEAFANRQQLTAVQSGGSKIGVQAKLDGLNLEALKPFCIAVYNNHLFIAGQDSGSTDEPAMVRHSFLGVNPRVTVGANPNFDKDAYNIIGAKGKRVTAMVPGENVLLVAKESELYRLSGSGRAVEGWHFAVLPVDNTEHVGVLWPGALCYAEGLWYGVGEGGPFITDGNSVEVIVGKKARSWQKITFLDRAWVKPHPDRRSILFGLVEEGNTRPNVVWVWNIDRREWVSEWRLPVTANDALAAPSNINVGPSAAPGAPTVNHASATTSAIAGTFVPGDSSASTRVWVLVNGTYVLKNTMAPGATNWNATGLPNTTHFKVKLQHVRNGVASDFSPEADAYTKVAAPTIQSAEASGQTSIDVIVRNNTPKVVDIELDVNGVLAETAQMVATGDKLIVADGLACSTTYDLRARAYLAEWPAAIQYSDYSSTVPGATEICVSQ